MTEEAPQILLEKKTRAGRALVIRKYMPIDRDRVRYVCSQTGFLGEPQEALFIGRDPFADLWSSYWTDYEPESAFVATVDGQVEAYLLGCLNTDRQERIWNKEIIPKVIRQIILPSWWKHSINRKFITAVTKSSIKGEMKAPMKDIKKEYPAHLHTNIADPELRGMGIGGALMKAYFDYLKENNIKGVHLGTTNHNRLAVPFYKHVGFETVWENHATFYDHAIPDPPLYLLYMGKKIV
jgi:ribosomal protein S18 acetylase RimI-like enzyme